MSIDPTKGAPERGAVAVTGVPKASGTPTQRPQRSRDPRAAGLLTAGVLVAGLGAAPVAATPPIDAWLTPAGARVLFVEAPDLPMLDVRIAFDAGSARDGAQSGLASLTADMLSEGADGLSADAIAERVEAVGASLATGAERDMAWASIRTLTEPAALETAVDTLVRVLAQPDFDAAELERVRENRLIALRLAEQSPSSVGSKAVYRAVFGEHPYAADPSGTAETVAAIDRADLRAFHQRYYTAPNATVAIVGAIDREKAAALAVRLTVGLPEGDKAPPLPPVADLSAGSVERISFPSSQTHLFLGQPGMRRGDPDYFPLYVGNHILGGSGLVSLLMNEVREQRGLSYSVYSYFVPMTDRGPMLMGLQTKNAQADEALAVLRETLERFVTDGPTDEELTAAVKNITGGFPLKIASNANIVQYLAMIGFYGLPLDYLERFTGEVSAVTAAAIRDAYQRRVQPERLAVVMVGGAAPATAPVEPPTEVPADQAQGPNGGPGAGPVAPSADAGAG